jgi:hypothetical protein
VRRYHIDMPKTKRAPIITRLVGSMMFCLKLLYNICINFSARK